eukprot:NODE_677_length_4824_cov_0.791323.p4 type:complete len:197 gc:universal NODE_677_length_4824_cov_0.791323:4259-3669(-)
MQLLKQTDLDHIYFTCKAFQYIRDQDYELAILVHEQMQMNHKTCFNLAMLYLKMANYKKSIYYFKFAIHLNPYLSVGYYYYGLLQMHLGDYVDAIALFDDCIFTFRNHDFIDYDQLGMNLLLKIQDVQKYRCICLYKMGLHELAALKMNDLDPINMKQICNEPISQLNELVLFKDKATVVYKNWLKVIVMNTVDWK